MVVTLFDVKKELKRRKFLLEEQKLLTMLSELPDFYLEMKWDFESSIIPFLNKLAPSGFFLKKNYFLDQKKKKKLKINLLFKKNINYLC